MINIDHHPQCQSPMVLPLAKQSLWASCHHCYIVVHVAPVGAVTVDHMARIQVRAHVLLTVFVAMWQPPLL